MKRKIIAGISFLLMIAAVAAGICRKETGISVSINEICASNGSNFQDEDRDFVDWIELYNNSDKSISLKGFGLSDKKEEPKHWEFPDVEIGPHSYLVVCASGKDRRDSGGELHTNFKINALGENIYFSDSQGRLVSELYLKKVEFDKSYGRVGESDEFAGLQVPTPGECNTTEKLPNIKKTEDVQFSCPAGWYEDEISLGISTKEKNAEIYYTVDGSIPDLASMKYEEKFVVSDRTAEPNQYTSVWCTPVDFWKGDGNTYAQMPQYKATVIKARLYFPEEDCWSEEVWTNTYLISADYSMPIVSLSVSEAAFFDEQQGIYVPGNVFDDYVITNTELPSDARIWRGNYSEDTKVAGYMEYFEEGQCNMEQEVSVRICGAASRGNAQKSFTVYGLGDETEKTFSSLRLRAFGNDWRRSMFRDALAQELVSHLPMGTQSYQPCILLINGEYFGVYELRENRDDTFFQEHFGIRKGNLVKTELFGLTRENADFYGNEFLDLVEFVHTNDLSIEENFEFLSSKLDIKQFIDYMIIEQYLYNVDWPENNALVFKSIYSVNDSPYEDEKWRFVLYDLDYAINYPMENNFAKLRESETYISQLLNGLLENENFVEMYKCRFEELTESCFEPSKALDVLDRFKNEFEPEIEETLLRWNVYQADGSALKEVTVEYWYQKIADLEQFFVERPEYAREYFYGSLE